MMSLRIVEFLKRIWRNINSGEANLKWKYLNWTSTLILIIGIGLGLYARMSESPNYRIWVMSIVSIAILAIVMATSFYFSMRRLFFAVGYMWCGYCLGIVGLHDELTGPSTSLNKVGSIVNQKHASIPHGISNLNFRMSVHETGNSAIDEVSAIFLLSSLLMRVVIMLSQRILGKPRSKFASTSSPISLFTFEEAFEWLGFCIACISYDDYVALWLLNCALAAGSIAVRVRSLLGVINMTVFVLVVRFLIVPQLLPHLHLSLPAILVYFGHLFSDSLFNFLFSDSHLVERCWSVLRLAPLTRHILLMVFASLELSFCFSCAAFISNHQEWVIMIPIFLFFAFLWVSFHFLLFITLWQLMRKISVCNRTYDVVIPTQEFPLSPVPSPVANKSTEFSETSETAEETRVTIAEKEISLGQLKVADAATMLQIMASKGVRHFSLVSYRVVCLALLSNIALGLVTWETRNALTMGLLLFILPLESIIVSAFDDMSSNLGGTCVGYAIVAPTLQYSMDRSVTVIPPMALAEAAKRCTQQLNLLQRFFSEHMIENFGCDYSSAGLSSDAVEIKLRSFFQRVTIDGPKYDTYLLYFSGATFASGDWALADGGVFKLQTLLDIWEECVGRSFDSRLILIVDSDNASHWLRPVRRLSKYVALQTKSPTTAADRNSSGNFTRDWVFWNSRTAETAIFPLDAVFGVSRSWTDFVFHTPTRTDLERHWEENYPKVARPLLKVINCQLSADPFCCSCIHALRRCLRRKKMAWLPPRVLPTGHGFRLVTSARLKLR